MATVTEPPAEPPNHKATFSTVVLVGSIVLLWLVFRPLWQPLFFAAILAAVLFPMQTLLAARLRGWRYLAAALMSVGVVLLILAPVAIIGVVAVRQAVETGTSIRDAISRGGVHELLRPLPDNIERWLQPLVERLPKELRSMRAGSATEAGRWAALQLQSAVSTVSTITFDLLMMLIALFFMLADGRSLVEWVRKVSPMGSARTQELLGEFRLVSRSVIGANFVTGLVQAALATLGYWWSGVPQPLFFGLLTLLTSFIPSVGTAIVLLPLAGLLFLLGHPWAALFLAVWSIPVGIVDNLLRPYLIRGDLNVHGALIFFSIIGGIGFFGLPGLVVGPMALVSFLTMLRFYRRDARQAAGA